MGTLENNKTREKALEGESQKTQILGFILLLAKGVIPS